MLGFFLFAHFSGGSAINLRKGGRSMTTEEKNKILKLIREDVPRREIARLTGYDPSTIIRFERTIEGVLDFVTCPICGKEIVNYIKGGRRKQYCCRKCYDSKKRRKSVTRTCLCCGKTFKAWNFAKTKYCSYSCFYEHKYGKRLQDKSS